MTTPRTLVIALALAVQSCASRSVQRVAYPDGTPHWEYEMTDGVPDGQGRVWHPNGNLRSEGPYVHGEKHGVFRFYADDGSFDHQALFVDDVETWRSTDRAADPPADLVAELTAADRKREEEFASWLDRLRDPVPVSHLALLDPVAAPAHVGLEIGDGEIQRRALFASYERGRYGGYGELLQTQYSAGGMSASGKRTLELGGMRRIDLDDIGTLTARAGLLVPIGNDDHAGYLGSALGAEVRPDDVAASFPSAFATRTGASLVRTHAYYVLQGDAGIDWILAGQARPFDAVLRANAGIGVGLRSAMATLQVSNAISMSDPTRHVDAVGIGATFWLSKMWLAGTYSHAFSGPAAMTMAVGRDL